MVDGVDTMAEFVARDIVAEIGAATAPDGINVIPPPGAARREY